MILTATAGEGHNQVAKSLYLAFKKMGHDSIVLDICRENAEWLKDFANGVYNWSINYVPKLYGAIYDSADKKVKETNAFAPRRLGQKFLSMEIKKMIKEFKPDVCIATHSYAANMLNDYVQDGVFNGISVGIVTDFTLHPFWEDAGDLDYFVVPHIDLKPQLERKDLNTDNMLDFGIPINEKFFIKRDKIEMRKKLGLDEDKKTVLLMSGSMSHVKVDKVVKRLDNLDEDFQIVVFLGKKKTFKKKIEKLKLKHKIKMVGFVENIEEYYDAADIIITKPGGLTTSECIAKCLPMILVEPIPGQEARNVEFLLNHQMALYASDTFLDVDCLNMFLSNEVVRNNIYENLRLNYKENPSRRLAEFLIQKVKERRADV